jgi:glyoxylase-like metal-dependent hydrolase (beta-lactamase superfamily II)
VSPPVLREGEPPYGSVERVSPLVRRIVAKNPSAFTYWGTGTYIVGNGRVAVIDPGPLKRDHVEALSAAVAGETVEAIVVTHTHMDHSPAAAEFSRLTGAPVLGCAPHADAEGEAVEEGPDRSYAPTRVLREGERIEAPGWTLEAVATPGHTSNHLCFAFAEERTLFSGDHVMGWSTTVVAPPDGNMAAYRASLEKLLARDEAVYRPTHGPAILEPKAHVAAYIAHRAEREAMILRALAGGAASVPEIVERVYLGLDPRLKRAAGRSTLAHLIDLERRGRVGAADGSWHIRV